MIHVENRYHSDVHPGRLTGESELSTRKFVGAAVEPGMLFDNGGAAAAASAAVAQQP